MGIVPKAGRRAGWRVIVFTVTFLAVGLLPEWNSGHAAGMKFVEGIVKGVSGTTIDVGGKTYTISGAPVRTASRKAVSPAELPGRKVTLHFRGGAPVFVLVHPKVVE